MGGCARCGAPATQIVEASRGFETTQLEVCGECYYSHRPKLNKRGGIEWERRKTLNVKYLLVVIIGSRRLTHVFESVVMRRLGGFLSRKMFCWLALLALPIMPALLAYRFILSMANPEVVRIWGKSKAAALGTLIPVLDPITLSIGFWVSLLIAVTVHELAHGAVAARLGYRPTSLGVIFAGPILIGFYVEIPRDIRDLRVYAAGPAANILVAAVFAAVLAVLGKWRYILLPPEVFSLIMGVHEPSPAISAPSWICWLNLWLGVINASPIIPCLDGQQILSTLLAKKYGKRGVKAGLYTSIALLITILTLILLERAPYTMT